MPECPICGTEYEEGLINLCDHCGFDLTPYPLTVGQIPTAYLEKEQTQLESVRQMWLKFEETKQKLLENSATQVQRIKYLQIQKSNFQEDLSQAEKNISNLNKQIKQLKIEQADAYDNRGNTYSDLKEYQKAIADYTKAIDINPRYAKAYYNRGNAYYDLKKYQRAIAYYTRAIDINPQYADAYVNRGIVYKGLKEYQKAKEDYKKAANIYQKQKDNAKYQQVIDWLNKLPN